MKNKFLFNAIIGSRSYNLSTP